MMDHLIYPYVISTLALIFSIVSFGWQHFRIKDAAVCTLVAFNFDGKKKPVFQFQIANLGTRSLLLNNFGVAIFYNPELHGKYMDISMCRTNLPQILKAGELTAVVVESPWSDVFAIEAAKYLEGKEIKGVKLYFRATPSIWNPKGKQMSATQFIGTYEMSFTDNSSSFTALTGLAFPISLKTARRSGKP